MTRSINYRCPMTGKYRYAGKTEAGKVAVVVTRKNIKEKQVNPIVEAYGCDHCMGWHVGHAHRAPGKVKKS